VDATLAGAEQELKMNIQFLQRGERGRGREEQVARGEKKCSQMG
jgi:hypothetical protein